MALEGYDVALVHATDLGTVFVEDSIACHH